jgi:hypothetical protein
MIKVSKYSKSPSIPLFQRGKYFTSLWSPTQSAYLPVGGVSDPEGKGRWGGIL